MPQKRKKQFRKTRRTNGGRQKRWKVQQQAETAASEVVPTTTSPDAGDNEPTPSTSAMATMAVPGAVNDGGEGFDNNNDLPVQMPGVSSSNTTPDDKKNVHQDTPRPYGCTNIIFSPTGEIIGYMDPRDCQSQRTQRQRPLKQPGSSATCFVASSLSLNNDSLETPREHFEHHQTESPLKERPSIEYDEVENQGSEFFKYYSNETVRQQILQEMEFETYELDVDGSSLVVTGPEDGNNVYLEGAALENDTQKGTETVETLENEEPVVPEAVDPVENIIAPEYGIETVLSKDVGTGTEAMDKFNPWMDAATSTPKTKEEQDTEISNILNESSSFDRAEGDANDTTAESEEGAGIDPRVFGTVCAWLGQAVAELKPCEEYLEFEIKDLEKLRFSETEGLKSVGLRATTSKAVQTELANTEDEHDVKSCRVEAWSPKSVRWSEYGNLFDDDELTGNMKYMGYLSARENNKANEQVSFTPSIYRGNVGQTNTTDYTSVIMPLEDEYTEDVCGKKNGEKKKKHGWIYNRLANFFSKHLGK